MNDDELKAKLSRGKNWKYLGILDNWTTFSFRTNCFVSLDMVTEEILQIRVVFVPKKYRKKGHCRASLASLRLFAKEHGLELLIVSKPFNSELDTQNLKWKSFTEENDKDARDSMAKRLKNLDFFEISYDEIFTSVRQQQHFHKRNESMIPRFFRWDGKTTEDRIEFNDADHLEWQHYYRKENFAARSPFGARRKSPPSYSKFWFMDF